MAICHNEKAKEFSTKTNCESSSNDNYDFVGEIGGYMNLWKIGGFYKFGMNMQRIMNIKQDSPVLDLRLDAKNLGL